MVRLSIIPLITIVACASAPRPVARPDAPTGPDVQGIVQVARDLADDSLKGRGPWTPENARAARILAARLERLGAKPVFGNSLLVPFVAAPRPRDTVFNVVGVLPSRSGSVGGRLVGITAHLDHLGVGAADSTGDTTYNGFLDDAIGVGMALDVARRFQASPGNRALVVMFFNLEEQGLLGSKALVDRPDAATVLSRMDLLIGVDAGSPAGEALEWQLMGASPAHPGALLADSIARARGWTTTATPPRGISDVFPFAQKGVPVIFPIPGARWRDYTPDQRAAAMRRFDHYHAPADEYSPGFQLVGTTYFAEWLWAIAHEFSNR